MSDLTVNDVQGLVVLATSLVRRVGNRFIEMNGTDLREVVDLQLDGREVKLGADRFLEQELLDELSQTEFSILSEESGFIKSNKFPSLLWVLDPLDGSYNYSRGLGPSMISLALWENNSPVFGVLFDLATGKLTFGGPNIGTYVEKDLVRVSNRTDPSQATLCTGFPSRFPMHQPLDGYLASLRRFGKIRMFGSAAASLWLVASGAADVYAEYNIMFWDVAAGLAIVNGAGGSFQIEGVDLTQGVFSDPCVVVASNDRLDASLAMFDPMGVGS